jgi:hypothetical protein
MKAIRTIIWSAIILAISSSNLYAYCHCSEPIEPSIPSGYYAQPYQMKSAKSEVESYLDEIQAYKQCLSRCIVEANSKAEDVIDQWNSAVRQYNNR